MEGGEYNLTVLRVQVFVRLHSQRDGGRAGLSSNRLAMDALGNALRKRRYALWTTVYKGERSDACRRACVRVFFHFLQAWPLLARCL